MKKKALTSLVVLAVVFFSFSFKSAMGANQHDFSSLMSFWEQQEHNEAAKLKAEEEAAKKEMLRQERLTAGSRAAEGAGAENKAASDVTTIKEAAAQPAALLKQPAQHQSDDSILLVDDFDGGVRSNLLGGAIGEWTKDEYDDTQGCEFDFVKRPRLGKSEGYSMQISYDVDSPNQAYNGIWIKLAGVDATPYKYLVMYLKAPNYPPYGTDTLKLELKNKSGGAGVFYIKRIPRGAWREYKIPLKKFKGLKDFSNLKELIFVFEDNKANPKEGFIFLEHLYFTKEKIQRPR